MDAIGEVLGGIADIAVTGSVIGSSGNGNKNNDGCGIFFGIIVVLCILIAIPYSCMKKEEPKPLPVKFETKRETIPHLLGRKSKDTVLEFGKGVIGK